jgi:hypothetical protein
MDIKGNAQKSKKKSCHGYQGRTGLVGPAMGGGYDSAKLAANSAKRCAAVVLDSLRRASVRDTTYDWLDLSDIVGEDLTARRRIVGVVRKATNPFFHTIFKKD